MIHKKLKKLKIGNACSIHQSAWLGFEEHGNGNLFIGNNVRIRPLVLLRTCGGTIRIGNKSVIGAFSIIHAHGSVVIGNDVLISPHVGIYAQNHGIKKGKLIRKQKQKLGKVVIQNNVWVGANAVIIGPAVIGAGSVIGAGVVVRGNIPKNSIVVNETPNIILKRK